MRQRGRNYRSPIRVTLATISKRAALLPNFISEATISKSRAPIIPMSSNFRTNCRVLTVSYMHALTRVLFTNKQIILAAEHVDIVSVFACRRVSEPGYNLIALTIKSFPYTVNHYEDTCSIARVNHDSIDEDNNIEQAVPSFRPLVSCRRHSRLRLAWATWRHPTRPEVQSKLHQYRS